MVRPIDLPHCGSFLAALGSSFCCNPARLTYFTLKRDHVNYEILLPPLLNYFC